MRKFIAAGVMLALAACSVAPEMHSPAEVVPSVVKIKVQEVGGYGEGSGVVISHGKDTSVILTCNHVTDGKGTVEVMVDGKAVPGYVMAADKAFDLALVQINKALPAVSMAPQKVSIGDVAVAAGYPLDKGLELSEGLVGAPDAHDHTLQSSVPIMPGNSGGGVFVNQGGWKLAGIAEAVATFGPFGGPVATISYFIPLERVQEFLKAHPV